MNNIYIWYIFIAIYVKLDFYLRKYIGPNLTIIIIIFLFLYPDRAMDVSHNYTGISFTINIVYQSKYLIYLYFSRML